MSKNRCLLLIILLCLPWMVFPQIGERTKGHFFLNLTGENVQLSAVTDSLYEWLDIDQRTTFKITRDEIDDVNIRHLSFQQYYEGIPVEENLVLIHSRNDIVKSVNGMIMGVQKSKNISCSKVALRSSNSGELKIVSVENKGETIYKIAYEIKDENKRVFLDYATQDTLKVIPTSYHLSTEGKGYTMYSGWQNMTVGVSLTAYGIRYCLEDDTRKICTLYGGNTTVGLDEVAQYRDICESYCSPSQTFGGIVSSVTITEASATWRKNSTIDSTLNLFVKIKDSKGNLLYESKVVNNKTLPVTWNLESQMIHVDELSTIEIYDKDSVADDSVDCTTISTVEPTTYSWSGSTMSGTFKIKANPAVDAHWGMQQVLDYYKSKCNRNGYNNLGTTIYQFVNPVGIIGKYYKNAYAAYDGSGVGYMVYGMGDGKKMKPLVALDILAHEFTHIVTYFNGNGGLSNIGESGALNESFSDIMATAVEFYSLGEKANWQIGENITILQSDLRRMNDPKKSGMPDREKAILNMAEMYDVEDTLQLSEEVKTKVDSLVLAQSATPMPDTYKGDYWVDTEDVTSRNDYGGIHTNASVQSYWFYLLSEGGEGTNDNNERYSVTGIGIDNAVKIAYRNLTFYLTPNATYEDAVEGSMRAAEDLFGASSKEQKSVYDAWCAVGLHLSKYDEMYKRNLAENDTTEDLMLYSANGSLYITNNEAATAVITSVGGQVLCELNLLANQEACIEMGKEQLVIVKVGTTVKKLIIQK